MLGQRGWSQTAWLAAIALIGFVVFLVAALSRYDHLSSGVDLAIFGQAIWHYSNFQAPLSTVKGENILGDHFSPIVALVSILYWIWSDPRTLLIVQAGLLAISVVPVHAYLRNRLAPAPALLLSAAYLAFWGLGVGDTFDFHELAFAPLLIAVALWAGDLDRMRICWLSVICLLFVKEDMSLVVCFIGVWLLTRRHWGHGGAMIVLGIAFYELVTKVVIPHFAIDHSYGYWSYGQLGGNPASAAWGLITHPWKLVTVGLSPVIKFHTVLALFAPFLFLSLASPVVLLAVPLLAERFLSTNPNYWSTHFHYSLPIGPVLAIAAGDGLARLIRHVNRVRSQRMTPDEDASAAPGVRSRTAPAILAVATIILAVNVGVSIWGTSDSALALDTGSGSYLPSSEIAAAKGALAAVPAGASVAAASSLEGHLVNRAVLNSLTASGADTARYIVIDVEQPSCCEGTLNAQITGQQIDPLLGQYTPVYYRDGWLVARRPLRGPAGSGVLTPVSQAAGRRLSSAVSGWLTQSLTTLESVRACASRQPAGGLACYQQTPGALVSRAATLTGALTAALPQSRGGCRNLLGLAGVDERELTAELTAIGQAQTLTGVARAYQQFAVTESDDDPGGLIERFVTLCTPRSANPASG